MASLLERYADRIVGCLSCYLEFLSALDDPSIPTKQLRKVAEPAIVAGRNYKGFKAVIIVWSIDQPRRAGSSRKDAKAQRRRSPSAAAFSASLRLCARPVRGAAPRPRWPKAWSRPGFNFFSTQDQALFLALVRGEHTISGLRNKDLRAQLDVPSSRVSRLLERLRVHGLIKRIGRTYKYYLTDLGRRVVLTGLELTEMVVIPQLATASERS